MSVQLDNDYDAYFTLTDYCNEVFTLLYNNKFPKPLLNVFFISLMETYKTLCDNEIYLVDIKPENMLLCSDGLYFIDVDDISIVRNEYINISNTTTQYYNTVSYKGFVDRNEDFVKKHQAFMKEHTDIVFSPDAAEQLEEIRERLEYEGWQALVKTYFGIKTGKQHEYNDMIQLLGRDSIFYGWIGNWLRQRTDPLIEQDSMLFNVLNSYNTGNDASIKNKNIRNWLAHENIRFYLKNLEVGASNIKLRF